jgi:hypothetical protein
LKYREVGKVATNDDPKLADLQDSMDLISGKETNGYEELFNGKKFRVYTKDQNLRITFEGSKGTPEDTKNVLNVVKNKPLEGEDIQEETEFLDDLLGETSVPNINGVDYTDVKFLGHSLGGYKARSYGAKYDVDSEILNGHIMPWNKFEATTAKADMHTIITDPLDLKYLIQPKGNLTHTYYQPLVRNQETTFITPHYGESWNNLPRQEQTEIAEIFKTEYPSLFANAGIASLSVAGSIYSASNDRNYNPTNDPMLGSATEAGIVGLNIDPDYQWGDEAPTSEADYIIWKSLQPIVKATASKSNPVQAAQADKRIEAAAGSNVSGSVNTFTYKGKEYYYTKDSSGAPEWYSESGSGPLSQDIKDAYNASVVPKEEEPFIDYTAGGF